MTNATASAEATEQYDPDSPPEDRGFLGTLTVSANVAPDGTVFPSYGPETDARIVEQVVRYTSNPKVMYEYEVWFLEAEAIDVVRSDGQPFRQSDIVKTRSTKGANLGANQAPAKLAETFRNHGVTASPLKVGTDESAVGRVFQFNNKSIKLGGGFEKPIKLNPLELMATDFVYDGEPRVITPKAADGDAGAAVDGGASTAPSEEQTIAILKEIFAGHTATEMMDLVLGDNRLSGVSTVFGVPLLESATDESLVSVLQEHRALAIGGDGKFVAL